MKRASGLTLARFLATLAIVLQGFLPGSIAVAGSNGVDVSHFMCTPSGEMSPETRAAAERIADLLGEDLTDEQAAGDHCPLCTFTPDAPLTGPAIIAAPIALPVEQLFARHEPGLVREAQGPPLGSRGPPPHI